MEHKCLEKLPGRSSLTGFPLRELALILSYVGWVRAVACGQDEFRFFCFGGSICSYPPAWTKSTTKSCPKDGQQCRQKLGARGLLCGPTRSRVHAGRVDRRGVQGQCSCSLAWWVSSPSHQAKGFGFWWEECANMASDPQGFSKELLLRVSQNRQVTFCQRKFPPTLAGDQKAHT